MELYFLSVKPKKIDFLFFEHNFTIFITFIMFYTLFCIMHFAYNILY